MFIVKRQIEQCFSCITWQEQAKDEDDARFVQHQHELDIYSASSL